MNTIMVVPYLLADWGHMDGGGWVFMGFGMLIFWALVIFGIVWLVRTLSDRRPPGAGRSGEPSALDVLDRKLAEGTVSVEDYRERRQLLTGERNTD